MKSLLILTALACVLATRLNHKQGPTWQYDKGVVVLNHQNFEEAIKHFHILLVDFYAPWCPHCQKLEPEYALAAQTLVDHQITLAKVDCTQEHWLAERFNVHGYPTLKIFTNQVEFPYHGKRNHQDIVDYMIRHQEYIELAFHSHLATQFQQTKQSQDKFLKENTLAHHSRRQQK